MEVINLNIISTSSKAYRDFVMFIIFHLRIRTFPPIVFVSICLTSNLDRELKNLFAGVCKNHFSRLMYTTEKTNINLKLERAT